MFEGALTEALPCRASASTVTLTRAQAIGYKDTSTYTAAPLNAMDFSLAGLVYIS